MWFAQKTTDLEFVAQAPYRFDIVALIDAPPARIFDAFAVPEGVEVWVPFFRGFKWHSESPQGVGSLRQFDMRGISFKERFLIWEPGVRLCFAIEAMTLPLMSRMLEDVQVETVRGGRTRMIWSVYYEPRLGLRGPWIRAVMEDGYRRSAQALNRYLQANRRPSDANGAAAFPQTLNS